ncbi:uncharacterized protein TNCV_1916391 [Trichonephila clavipes]|uniref:Uncharacterized protein n=1 Tax=Trichonephila clavipes TaxID=2585209 RepID=A0A8X6W0P2_TRICX|nr:uncharacterized protein TNCV_1916391 [Trichonephila clavipes]
MMDPQQSRNGHAVKFSKGNSEKDYYISQTNITRACDATSKHNLRLGDFDISSSAIAFSSGFFKKRSVMSRRKQRSAFDQVSDFDRGRIVAYRNCGLTFRKIGSRVGRNQTIVMRICDRWMQKCITDRRGRSD